MWVLKSGEFDAYFESVEKVWKKVTGKKLKNLELLSTALKDGKQQKPFTVMRITFCRNFFATFSTE